MKWWSGEKKKDGPRPQVDVANLQSARRARRKKRQVLAGIFIFAGVIAMFVHVIFISSFMRVRHIEVSGNYDTPKEDVIGFLEDTIRAKSWVHAFMSPAHFLLWTSGEVSVNPRVLPHVKRMRISLAYRARSVRVEIEEREPFGIWCRMNAGELPVTEANPTGDDSTNGTSPTESIPQPTHDCMWFDTDGFTLGPAPFAEGNIIPTVRDYSGVPIDISSRVLRESEMAQFQSILRVLAITDVSVQEMRIDDRSLEEFIVKATRGPKLYFSLRFSADPAIAVLKFLWGSSPSSSRFAELEYVDFRVENRAFYK
jgi:hypothetical protein